MKLKEYFEKTGVQKNWFAKKIGIDIQTFYVIVGGKKKLPMKYWKKVILVSEGKIKLEDLAQEAMKFEPEPVELNDYMKTNFEES